MVYQYYRSIRCVSVNSSFCFLREKGTKDTYQKQESPIFLWTAVILTSSGD